MEDFLSSARFNLVASNLLQQYLCHIALLLIKVAYIPLPSLNCSKVNRHGKIMQLNEANGVCQ